MATDFHCKICDIHCNGEAPYKQHLSSTKHIKKASLSPPTSPEQSVAAPNSASANTGSSPVPTNIDENVAISSTSVSISPDTMRILLEWNHPLGYKPYCDICQLPLYGSENADIHFRPDNNIHHQKVAALKQIRANDARFSCKVCSEIFPTDFLMGEHFLSATHATMIEQKNNLEKIIKIYETYNKLKETRKQAKASNPVARDDLSEQFEKLKVIDGTSPTAQSEKGWQFNSDRLRQAMQRKYDDDD